MAIARLGKIGLHRVGARATVFLVATAMLIAACGRTDASAKRAAVRRLERAVATAKRTTSYRVRGRLGSRMSWEGFVVDGDEQYVVDVAGLRTESRRIGGRTYGRRVETADESWVEAPNQAELELSVLQRGEVMSVDAVKDHMTLTLQFEAVDVLAALTHIPSVGATRAVVEMEGDVIQRVALQFADGTTASLDYWDYGVALQIQPLDPGSLTRFTQGGRAAG